MVRLRVALKGALEHDVERPLLYDRADLVERLLEGLLEPRVVGAQLTRQLREDLLPELLERLCLLVVQNVHFVEWLI